MAAKSGPLPPQSGASSWKDDSAPLLSEIHDLEEHVEAVDLAYEGLRELDDLYRLIDLKLDISLLLLTHRDVRDIEDRTAVARTQATDALVLTDSLQTSNISLDQKDEFTNSEEMLGIREKLQNLVVFGGANLFDAENTKQARVRRVGASIKKALLKYTGGQHQTSGPQVKTPDHLAAYEIPEGEEDINLSEKIVLPLSQAVVLIEEEMLPALEDKLAANPGDPELIRRKNRLIDQVADYKTSKFFPRARPATMEKDLFTAALAGYTASGEVLVTINLPSIQSSGNTYDHLLEHLRVEIVRDSAGMGISPRLDAAVKTARSLESGKRGALLEVLNKLDVPALFRELSVEFPFLRRLESRQDLKLLADLAAKGQRNELKKIISVMAEEDTNLLETSNRKLQLPTDPLEE
ncbi:MAG: hypothetical protein HN368_11045 [Spirochaetales bacterium]|nr:hypothetical protein [Spirochaetales bacterium]